MNAKIQSFQKWINFYLAAKPYLKPISVKSHKDILSRWVKFLEPLFNNRKIPSSKYLKIISCWINTKFLTCSTSTIIAEIRIFDNFLIFLKGEKMLSENPFEYFQQQYPKRHLSEIIKAIINSNGKNSLLNLLETKEFSSCVGDKMKEFIELNRTLGKKFHREKCALSQFDRFLRTLPNACIDARLIENWISQFGHCKLSYRYSIFTLVRRFCLYLRRFNPDVYIPDMSLAPSNTSTFLPYIFSKQQIISLLESARQLPSTPGFPHKPQMVYFFLLLLYTTGMRLSEVLKLRVCDINWIDGSIFICETKFFKSRIIPLSASVIKVVKGYIQTLKELGISTQGQQYIFCNLYHKKICAPGLIQLSFRQLLRKAGLKPERGRTGPRLHDLRATFAVHRLTEWYRNGEDVQANLARLSTYLGHNSIAATQKYLPMTTELFELSSQRFNQFVYHKSKGEKK